MSYTVNVTEKAAKQLRELDGPRIELAHIADRHADLESDPHGVGTAMQVGLLRGYWYYTFPVERLPLVRRITAIYQIDEGSKEVTVLALGLASRR